MTREHFLCSASGIKNGEKRTLTVYKLHGQAFRIYNDRGHSSSSDSSSRVTERDIKKEITQKYGVRDLVLEGSVREGVISSTWPTAQKCCANCGGETTRRPYGGRGYCGLCLSMKKALATLKTWDREKPETFCLVPKSAQPDRFMICRMKREEFEIWRQELIRQAEERLAYLRSREEKRGGRAPVEGADLEAKLGGLLHAIRPKAKYRHNADDIDRHFNSEQRRVLYGLLDEIEDHILWRGFSRWKASDLINEHNHKQRM